MCEAAYLASRIPKCEGKNVSMMRMVSGQAQNDNLLTAVGWPNVVAIDAVVVALEY